MGRPLRIEYPGALYHITSRGNEKKDIFLRDNRCWLKEKPGAEKILQIVAEKYGEKPEELKGRGRNKAARKVAIYVMKRYSGLSNREVAKQFGGLHYSAVTKTCTRLEIEMKGDKTLHEVIQEVMSNVKT